jgi:hypothetical protein
MRFRSLMMMLTAGLTSMGLTGCLQTCQQVCVENARYVDGCLEEWDALWSDFGYDGRSEVDGSEIQGGPAGEYISRCEDRYAAAIRQSGPQNGRIIREGCADDLGLVAAAVGCDDYQPNDDVLDPND